MTRSNDGSESGKGTEVERKLTADQLRNIQSFDDALALLQSELGAPIYDASTEIGDGFELLEDKERLCGVPFLAVQWVFADGDYGKNPDGTPAQFLVMRVVTADGHKWVITDGSTGLCTQLRDFSMRTGDYGGLVVKGGLRKSDYKKEVIDPSTGEVSLTPATTFYLNV